MATISGEIGDIEDQPFYDTVEETAEKLWDHLMDIGPKVTFYNKLH